MSFKQGFKVVDTTLSAAVAASGTFTIAYPTGTDEDTFAAYGHEAMAIGNFMTSPGDFTLTFNSASITFTYGSGKTTLPVGTKVSVQLNMPEVSERGLEKYLPVAPTTGPKASSASLVRVDLGSPIVGDANGVFESASITAAADITGALLLDAAALVSGNVATFDVPRNVVAAWTTTSVMTVTGTDAYGNVQVESSASGTSFTGLKAFATIDTISVTINVTSATVGTGNVLGLPVYLADVNNVLAEFEDSVIMRPNHEAAAVYVHYSLNAIEFIAGTSKFVTSPIKGEVRSHTFVVDKATISAHDVIMGLEIGNTDIVGLQGSTGDLTSKVVGTVVTDTIAAGVATAAIAKNGAIEIDMDLTAQTAGALEGTIEIRPTTDYVAAVDDVQTATNGDVRGTYTPSTTPDGAVHFEVLLWLEDAAYLGLPTFAG